MAFIEIKNLNLCYPVLYPDSRLLKSKIGRFRAKDANEKRNGAWIHQSLTDISLRVESGERVGLVGRNGAGKTTLLKVIAGVYKPWGGSILRQGYTATLINPDVGMDTDATGYENIMLLGRIAKLPQSAILEKLPEIEDFTELGSFLDMPLYTYSAGMRMRLGFAITTMMNPEILLADEYFGTGDAHFINKARKRLGDLYGRSSIVVLASHARGMIEEMCTRAVLMHKGRIVVDGPVAEVYKEYLASTALQDDTASA